MRQKEHFKLFFEDSGGFCNLFHFFVPPADSKGQKKASREKEVKKPGRPLTIR
jgi:hypothetical protein